VSKKPAIDAPRSFRWIINSRPLEERIYSIMTAPSLPAMRDDLTHWLFPRRDHNIHAKLLVLIFAFRLGPRIAVRATPAVTQKNP
jgi:hypothetical protein